MSEINESTHIILDERVSDLISVLISELKYELMTKAVDGIVKLEDVTDPHSWIDMVGKEFNEFLKDAERKHTVLRLPNKVSFMLPDNINPCSNLFASDCKYIFSLGVIKEKNESDLSSAFVTVENGYACVHCADIHFSVDIDYLDGARGDMRHEIKHVYSELLKHVAKEKEKGVRTSDDEKIKLGSLKSAIDNKKMDVHKKVITVINGSERERPLNRDEDILFTSLNLMASVLYYLSKDEKMANYSKYYESLFGVQSYGRITDVYKQYLDLYEWVNKGKPLFNSYDCENDNSYPVFDNQKAYDMIKPMVKLSFKYVPETVNEFKENVLIALSDVMRRFDLIFERYRFEKESGEKRFTKAYNRYFENLLENYQQRYGNIDGLYEFTLLKNYRTKKIPFMDALEKIEILFDTQNSIGK